MISGNYRQTRFSDRKPGKTVTSKGFSTYPDAQARATAKLFRRVDAEIAVTEQEAVKLAQYANTERLRGLRLAREAELGAATRAGSKRN